MRASLIIASSVIVGAISLGGPAIAAIGPTPGVSSPSDLITVVKAKKQAKKSTKSTAPDESGGTPATGSNATPGGK